MRSYRTICAGGKLLGSNGETKSDRESRRLFSSNAASRVVQMNWELLDPFALCHSVEHKSLIRQRCSSGRLGFDRVHRLQTAAFLLA